jgi:ABC-type ATPase involved in cell division
VSVLILQHSCGISVKEGELPSMSYQGEAQRLGVARHVFKAPATTLDRRSKFFLEAPS